MLTYVTNPAVHAAWVHPAVDRHVTVTPASAERARADHGVPAVAGGPLVPRRFGRVAAQQARSTRRRLPCPADRPVALLAAGSLGLGDVPRAAFDVAAAGFVPLVLCGRNAALVRELATVPDAVALGWREELATMLAAQAAAGPHSSPPGDPADLVRALLDTARAAPA